MLHRSFLPFALAVIAFGSIGCASRVTANARTIVTDMARADGCGEPYVSGEYGVYRVQGCDDSPVVYDCHADIAYDGETLACARSETPEARVIRLERLEIYPMPGGGDPTSSPSAPS